jgi:TRAP-type transport system small permease protein
MTFLNNLLTKVDRLITYVSAITIFIMMMWIVMDVVLRSVFNSPITGTIEITGEYLLLIIVYLSISYTYKEGNHVSVDFIVEMLPKSLRKVLKVTTNLLSIAAFSFLGYANFLKGLDYFANNVRTTSLLHYPLAPALMIIALGVFLLVINLLLESIAIIRGKVKV